MKLKLHNLNNIRTLRAIARTFSIEVLEEVLKKFKIITEEKRKELEQIYYKRAEKQKKINNLLELMKADGLSPKDLFFFSRTLGEYQFKKKSRTTKYRFTDQNCKEKN